MTREEMVALLRQHLSDEQRVGWPEDREIIAYMDRAAAHLSHRLIVARDPALIKTLRVSGKTPLPADFVSFVGNVPVRVVGRECAPYGHFGVPPKMRWRKAGVADDPGGPIWGEPEKGWDELTGTSAMDAQYWSSLPSPSAFADEALLPYTPEQATLILDIARIFALNKNEYDLSQDMALLNEIDKAIAAAKGGR